MENQNETNSVGTRIASARETCQLTTAQLSRRLGVQTRTLSSWEADQTQPRANRLTMLAGMLGVSPSWLLVGHGTGPVDDFNSSELQMAKSNLDRLKDLQQQTAAMIDGIQRQLGQNSQAPRA